LVSDHPHFDPRAARFEESGVLWWTSMRTYRPGDWAHYALAIPGLLLSLVFLWVGFSNDTLTTSWATPVVILGLLAYGWFALTKKYNRRTVTLDSERLQAWDSPLFNLARKVSVPVAEIGKLETSEVTSFTMPPTQMVKTYNVDARGVRGHIIKKLATAEEADTVRAGLVAALARLN
jgi:hypothetical protein